MTEAHDTNAGDERDEQQEELADVQDELDAQADGDGLAAEAGTGDETGLSEG
ncbi:hypothetical protein [Nocardioides lijunqiniae]|uniref:hypothetical protein n=1 Tax=Nocardioides lijunqiniae TaxID=2760832 RepID=UPI0018782C9C|nr:hypothetical protein [Nocardioides lijunqiniae]